MEHRVAVQWTGHRALIQRGEQVRTVATAREAEMLAAAYRTAGHRARVVAPDVRPGQLGLFAR